MHDFRTDPASKSGSDEHRILRGLQHCLPFGTHHVAYSLSLSTLAVISTKETGATAARFLLTDSTPSLRTAHPETMDCIWAESPMILLAVALEIGLYFSKKRNGFAVPQHNIFSFASPAFLLAFFPTLLIAPVANLWLVTDWAIRYYQPYIMLLKGNARAKDTVLSDYMSLNKFYAFAYSIKRKHLFVLTSLVISTIALAFQPLAGGIFELPQVLYTTPTVAKVTSDMGLASDIVTLNPFNAAAGFTDAAEFQGLPDPPFVSGNWVVGQVQLPESESTADTIIYHTGGIQTLITCTPANTNVTVDTDVMFSISAFAADGCGSRFMFNLTDASQQYDAQAADAASCGMSNTTAPDFLPALFWFFHMKDDSTPQASAVICRPTLELYNVTAEVGMSDGSLKNVTNIAPFKPSPASSSPFNGTAYNGIAFGAALNAFTATRAATIGSTVSSIIFRVANQSTSGLQSVFDSNGFLPLTTEIYTRYLSVTAKSIYFVPSSRSIDAQMKTMQQRLIVSGLAGHGLATLLFIVGLTGLVLHTLHRRHRRTLYLTAPPGSIASSLALAYHSGFGELLTPYDDEKSMQRKLASLRFGFDMRTGAIVAEEVGRVGSEGGYGEDKKGLLGGDVYVSEMEVSEDERATQSDSTHSAYPLISPYESEHFLAARQG
ncbi:hypothetical protein A0H81_07130 [Grifola frondosa]|uniref:Uncharacterized protein n=1 Tax=Grifola frondosa TaxID=5627 RepID=A0A1C7M979_GRIFR|nr:hypothetical protein A0H81_07130 [Grifola frondosa]